VRSTGGAGAVADGLGYRVVDHFNAVDRDALDLALGLLVGVRGDGDGDDGGSHWVAWRLLLL
jgi:hypothetical protein